MRLWVCLTMIGVAASLSSQVQAGFRDDQYNCRQLVQTNPDRAIAACRSAISLAERAPEVTNDQGHADLWFHMAMAFEAKNERMKTIGALDSAISLYSGDQRFYWLRIRQWQALENCGRAIADFGTYIQMSRNPKHGYGIDKGVSYWAYMGRGACHEKQGAQTLAKADYDAALALFPDDKPAKEARERLDRAPDAQPAKSGEVASEQEGTTATPGRPAIKPLGEGVAATPQTSGPALPKRVALVIGNSEYLYTNRLQNAVNDAKDVSTALQAKGYTVYGYPRVNMHREDMFDALDTFSQAAAGADIALVWYAGHGQQMAGPGEPARNWLFPVDFKGGTDLDRGAVPLAKLLNAAQAAKRLRVVVVDACRNNTLQGDKRAARGFKVEPRADMVVVYSTTAGELADDGGNGTRNSPFAAAFLDVFKSHGKLDVRQFFGGVGQGVRERTKHQDVPQQPELMSNLNTLETLALAP